MTSPALDRREITPVSNLSGQKNAKREFWVTLAALTALYVMAVAIGNRRYVWFDELLTLDIARSTSLHELWNRLVRFDCNPPPTYILSRISMSIFGSTPFGLRFPSMLEFYLGSVAILLYVRRKAETAFAAMAVLMLWAVAPTLYYAVEARPYALFFLSFACLLLSWDIAVRPNRRGWALLAVSISTLALAGAHVFAPFTLFAFVLAEAVRFRRRRKPDYPLWAALLLPSLVMLLYIPLVRLYGGVIFGVHVGYNTLILFFAETFGASIMAFVLLAIVLIPLRHRAESEDTRFLPEEIALFSWMFLTPVLLNFILWHRHGVFYNRYGLTSQVAILTVLSIFLAHRAGMNRVAAYAACAVLILAILKDQFWHPLRFPPPQQVGVLASVQPDRPIVVGDGRAFYEMNHREPSELMDRLYYLKDRQASLQYAHTNFFQDFEAPDDMQQAGFPLGAHVAPYSSFVARHPQFLLLDGPTGWVLPKLLASGAAVVPVHDYRDAMPYIDTTLYSVTMPAH